MVGATRPRESGAEVPFSNQTVSFIEDIDGPTTYDTGECACANCRSEGEYEDIHGVIPDNCRYRWHTRCQGCDYYGPIKNAERLCGPCHRAFGTETDNR